MHEHGYLNSVTVVPVSIEQLEVKLANVLLNKISCRNSITRRINSIIENLTYIFRSRINSVILRIIASSQ